VGGGERWVVGGEVLHFPPERGHHRGTWPDYLAHPPIRRLRPATPTQRPFFRCSAGVRELKGPAGGGVVGLHPREGRPPDGQAASSRRAAGELLCEAQVQAWARAGQGGVPKNPNGSGAGCAFWGRLGPEIRRFKPGPLVLFRYKRRSRRNRDDQS